MPPPVPVATSYGSVDPIASALFLRDIFNATLITPNMTCGDDGHDDAFAETETESAWVKLPGSGYEFHFIRDLGAAAAALEPTSGVLDFPGYVAYVDGLNGNLSLASSSDYNQFMDFHVGMITDDMTPFYLNLKKYNGTGNWSNPGFFMVGQYPDFFDLFTGIPGTGAIFELTSRRFDIQDVPIDEWDICQVNSSMAPLPPPSSDRSGVWSEGDELPVVNWRKTTIASSHPFVAEAFALRYLDFQWTASGHPGTFVKDCANIRWCEYNYTGPGGVPYQLHFVNGFSYPPHDGLNISVFESLVEDARDFKGDRYDVWADNRLALWVGDNLDRYVGRFQADGVPFLARRSRSPSGRPFSVLVDIPLNGAVIELVGDALTVVNATRTIDEDVCVTPPPPQL